MRQGRADFIHRTLRESSVDEIIEGLKKFKREFGKYWCEIILPEVEESE